MIEHQPYGNDDPYKSTAVERFPREPAPAQAVQIGFRTDPDASEAWLEMRHAAAGGAVEQARVAATDLGDGLWTADIGPFEGGRVEYRLSCLLGDGTLETADHAFEVGRWVSVTGIAGVELDGSRVVLGLRTSGTPARLLVSFPTEGAARCELQVGERLSAEAPNSQNLPTPQIEDGPGHTLITGPGIRLRLDKETLSLASVSTTSARKHVQTEAPFSVDLALRWLERPASLTTPVQLGLRTGEDERIYGLGERFMDAHRDGKAWDVRVYEEFKEQRQRTYIPVPLIVTSRGNGLWLEADEPSYFDLRESDATLSIDRLTDPA